MAHSMMVKLITGPSAHPSPTMFDPPPHASQFPLHTPPQSPPTPSGLLHTHTPGGCQPKQQQDLVCADRGKSADQGAKTTCASTQTCSELLPTHLAPSPCRLPTQPTSWREPGDPSSHAPLSGFAPQPMSAASASAPPPVPTSLERCCSARTSRCAAPARNPLPPPPCRRCAPPTPANTKSATLPPQHPATCEKKCSLRGHITKLD